MDCHIGKTIRRFIRIANERINKNANERIISDANEQGNDRTALPTTLSEDVPVGYGASEG